MRHSQCKCGKSEYFDGGIAPQPCQGCDECGTTYGGGERIPHDWEPRFNSRTGEPAPRRCRRCYQRERVPA